MEDDGWDWGPKPIWFLSCYNHRQFILLYGPSVFFIEVETLYFVGCGKRNGSVLGLYWWRLRGNGVKGHKTPIEGRDRLGVLLCTPECPFIRMSRFSLVSYRQWVCPTFTVEEYLLTHGNRHLPMTLCLKTVITISLRFQTRPFLFDFGISVFRCKNTGFRSSVLIVCK